MDDPGSNGFSELIRHTDPALVKPEHFTQPGKGTLYGRAVQIQVRSQGIHHPFLDQGETTFPAPERMKVIRTYLRILAA